MSCLIGGSSGVSERDEAFLDDLLSQSYDFNSKKLYELGMSREYILFYGDSFNESVITSKHII